MGSQSGRKTLWGFSIYSQSKTGCCIAAKKKEKLKRIRGFQAEFTMTIFGKKPVRLLTIPGVFSHREVDQGRLPWRKSQVGNLKKAMRYWIWVVDVEPLGYRLG